MVDNLEPVLTLVGMVGQLGLDQNVPKGQVVQVLLEFLTFFCEHYSGFCCEYTGVTIAILSNNSHFWSNNSHF